MCFAVVSGDLQHFPHECVNTGITYPTLLYLQAIHQLGRSLTRRLPAALLRHLDKLILFQYL
jgi:hypothetical protein